MNCVTQVPISMCELLEHIPNESSISQLYNTGSKYLEIIHLKKIK